MIVPSNEKRYFEILLQLVKTRPKKDNVQEWEGYWHTIIGFSLAHICYMEAKYSNEMKYCMKDVHDSTIQTLKRNFAYYSGKKKLKL